MIIFANQEIFENLQIGTNLLELPPESIHYLKNVIRLKYGDKIIINSKSNNVNQKKFYTAKLLRFLGKNSVELSIEKMENQQKNLPIIDVFIVPLKSRYIDNSIEYLTYLPINSIYFINSINISTNFKELITKKERFEKIIFWNSIYSKKHYLINIDFIYQKLSELMDQIISKYEKIIVFDNLTENEIKKIEQKRIAVFIGPEGGWNPKEIQIFQNHNVDIFKFKHIDWPVKAQIAHIIGISQLLILTS